MWCSSYGVCSRFCPQTVMSSGICFAAGYVIPYLPSEGQRGMQLCGGPGAVEKPRWGPAFTSGCRLPLCSVQPLPPQPLTDLPRCVLRWFVLASARITFLWWLSTMFVFGWHSHGHQLFGRLFWRGCHISLTVKTAYWLSGLLYDFLKVDLLSSALHVGCIGWHGWVPITQCLSRDSSFWGHALCSPWIKMFLGISCAESSTSGHFENFESSNHRLSAKYILCWFLSLQASELEGTCNISCYGEILFMYIFLVVLITLWNYFKVGSGKEQTVNRYQPGILV